MMISTTDDCYRHFLKLKGLDGDGDPDLVGLFGFSLVERERLEWIDHCKQEGMGDPTIEAIQAWYGQKPASYFDEKLKQAVTRFDLYARGYLADDIEAAKRAGAQEAVGSLRADVTTSKTAIVTAIGSAQDKGGHWWRGSAQGALGNLMFAIVVIGIFWVTAHNTDLIAWGRQRLGL
jgi:hypothetical protein